MYKPNQPKIEIWLDRHRQTHDTLFQSEKLTLKSMGILSYTAPFERFKVNQKNTHPTSSWILLTFL